MLASIVSVTQSLGDPNLVWRVPNKTSWSGNGVCLPSLADGRNEGLKT